jgi:hypothetical protein
MARALTAAAPSTRWATLAGAINKTDLSQDEQSHSVDMRVHA